MAQNHFQVLDPESYYSKFIDQEKRPDGRKWMEPRPVTTTCGSIKTAEGSATIRLGQTTVVCGIKAEVAIPDLKRPDQGFLVPNVELYPCCSGKIKAGPPGQKAMSTTSFLANIIQTSGLIDLKSLCIQPSKFAWVLHCDIVCLDLDGNLFDASIRALVAALQNVRLPQMTYDEENEKLTAANKLTRKLTLNECPSSMSFGIYNSDIQLIDPTAEDEDACSGTLTVVNNKNDECSTFKYGGTPLDKATVAKLIEEAKSSLQSEKSRQKNKRNIRK